MYSFRQRPLTWLFWIATACLDIVGLSTDYEADWFNELAMAQIFVASGWLVLGLSHRLLRAAVFVLTILAFTGPDYLAPKSGFPFPSVITWEYVLGTVIVAATATALATSCWYLIARYFAKSAAAFHTKWQFPLVEIFGWMIIVAVASIAIRSAAFDYLPHVRLLTVPAAAGLIMVLFLEADGLSAIFKAMFAAIAIVASFISLSELGWGDDLHEVAVVFGFVGLWVLVVQLDEQAIERAERPTYESPERRPG